MKIDPLFAADLFAGAGGTSTGLVLAASELGLKIDLTAVNHWKAAIETHELNYPWAKHLQADVEAVNPLEAIPKGYLDILVASPECTHHSRAAGGRPKNEQKRASAWAIFRWLEFLRVNSVLVENVPEFTTWGPLDRNNRPVKMRRGEIYRAWLEAFRAHGYTVEAKILNAADFGAPTSRSRLFVAARRGRKRPVWPLATHSKKGWPKKKWKPAREIIDWSIKGTSIFNRKKPLSPRTIQRIMEGLRRFGGRELRNFLNYLTVDREDAVEKLAKALLENFPQTKSVRYRDISKLHSALAFNHLLTYRALDLLKEKGLLTEKRGWVRRKTEEKK